MLPHTSPHCIVSVIPGVSIISILQIRTPGGGGGDKEKRGDSGLGAQGCSPHFCRGDTRKLVTRPDTEPGRAYWKERLIPSSCAASQPHWRLQSRSLGSSGRAREGAPQEETWPGLLNHLTKAAPLVSWCRMVSHFSGHHHHLQELKWRAEPRPWASRSVSVYLYFLFFVL